MSLFVSRGSASCRAPWTGFALLVVGLLAGTFSTVEKLQAQGPPIFTETAIMLGLQGRGVRSFVQWTERERRLDPGSGSPSRTHLRQQAIPLIIPYNLFSDRFQVAVVVPFVRAELSGENARQRRAGIGDLQIVLKQLLYQQDGSQQTFRILAKVGLEWPTGKDELPALGSGTTDWFLGLVATHIKKRVGLYGELFYQYNGRTNVVDKGDLFQLKSGVGYRIFPSVYRRYPARTWNGYLELAYQTMRGDRQLGVKEPVRGGWMVLLAPGIQFIGGRRWLLELGLQRAVVQRLPAGALPFRWSLRAGTRILLF